MDDGNVNVAAEGSGWGSILTIGLSVVGGLLVIGGATVATVAMCKRIENEKESVDDLSEIFDGIQVNGQPVAEEHLEAHLEANPQVLKGLVGECNRQMHFKDLEDDVRAEIKVVRDRSAKKYHMVCAQKHLQHAAKCGQPKLDLFADMDEVEIGTEAESEAKD